MPTDVQEQDKATEAPDFTAALRSLDQERGRIGALEEQSVGRTQRLAEQEATLARQRGEARAAAVPAVQQASDTLTTASRNAPAPEQKRRPFLEGPAKASDSIRAFVQALSMLAPAVAGIVAKDGVTATNALNGAMQGWLAGDSDRLEKEMATWKASTERLIGNYKLQHEHYQDVLESSKLTLDMKLKALELSGMQYEDQMLVTTAQQKGEKATLDLLLKRGKDLDALEGRFMQMQIQYDLGQMRHQDNLQREKDAAKRHQEDLDEKKRHNQATEKNAAAGGGDQFTPEAIETLAQRFLLTGEIPGMGMGKAATAARTKVLNRVGEIMHSTGTTVGDQVAKQAAVKSMKQALTKIEQQQAMVLQFEGTANKNLGVLEEWSSKVGRSGVPVLDKWILAGRKSTGDPDVASFNAAAETAINETATVLSGSMSGVQTDSKRQEIREMLNTAMSPAQIKSVVATLRRDMQNRKESLRDESQMIQQTIAGSAGAVPAGAPAAPGSLKGQKAPDGVKDGEYTVKGQRVQVVNGVIQ